MEENSSKEIPVAVAEIPPLEENMVAECDPVPPPDDENAALLAEYKKEMMQNGLVDSDVDYLLSEYQDLENVKTVKMHCTSCDKHLGSAPNAIQDRYEHPLLKVLICAKCFQFYTSGEFEKDEDGSELYCRWCGEGGQVFCCSKCPFVFCKKCITRNLGKSMAKIIGSSDNWVCFSCDPSSISRPRASYWAVQKYSSIMIQKAEETGNKSELYVDGNTCCFGVKRRHSTLEQILRKKPKSDTMSLYQHVLDTTNKNRKKRKRENDLKNKTWHELISEQPEDEVICTPDILPLEPLDDESPPHSPAVPTELPPPLYPVIHHPNMPSNVPLQIPVLQPMPPLMMRAPVPKITVAELQNQLQKKYTQIVLTPRPRSQNSNSNQTIMIQKTQPLLPKTTPPSNGNYKFVINSKSKTFVPNVVNANFVLTSTASKTDAQAPVATTSKPITTTSKTNTITSKTNITTSKANTTTSKANTTTSKANSTSSSDGGDWFEKAVLDCTELTEYLSARISTLSEMHKKNTTDRSVAELYKSFQSYMDIILGKIGNIKRTMVSNYEKEMENRMREKIVNPFAIKTAKRARKAKSDSDYVPTSSEDSNSTDSFIIINEKLEKPEKPRTVSTSSSTENPFAVVNNHNKTPLITTNNMKPEEVLFDMDVTNASDEERNTSAPEHKDDSDSDVQEVEYTRNTEVIQIEDSDDDVIEEKEIDALAFCDTEINENKEIDESVTTENKETDESVTTENKETDESVTTENKETDESVTTENKEIDEPVTTKNKEVDESVTTDEKNSESKDIDEKMIEKEIDDSGEKIENKEMNETPSTDEKMIEKEIDETPSTDEKMIEKDIDETPSIDEKMIDKEIDETSSTDEKMIEKEIDETPSTDEKMTENTEFDETHTTDEKIIVDEEIPAVNEKKEIGESPTIAIKVLRNIKDKFNIENMTIPELIKYLSAVIIANKSTNESANQTISEKDRRDIVKKIISRIESLSEERFAKTKKRRTIRRHKQCEKNENETNIEHSTKQDCSENRENIENDDLYQITTQTSTNTDDDLKYLGDIEDILAGNVVLRPTNTTGFVDEFSKFVTNKSDEPSEDISDGLIDALEPSEDMSDGLIDALEPSVDMSDDLKGTLETSEAISDCLKDTLESSEEMSDALKDTLIIARELDIIPEYVDDICNNRDNGSLSLPPDCITGISASDLSMLVKESEENVNNGNEVLKKENESDIILNSEILALQQLAENCVSSVDVHKSSAECKG